MKAAAICKGRLMPIHKCAKAASVMEPSIAARALQIEPFSGIDAGSLFVARTGYTGEDGFEIAQALRATLSYPFILEGLEPKLDVSIGEAKNLPGESLADQLLRRADEAMYRAKRTKAGVLTWSPELGSPELGSRGMRL